MALYLLLWKDVCGRMLQPDLPTVPRSLFEQIDCHPNYLSHIICLENGNPAAEMQKSDYLLSPRGRATVIDISQSWANKYWLTLFSKILEEIAGPLICESLTVVTDIANLELLAFLPVHDWSLYRA